MTLSNISIAVPDPSTVAEYRLTPEVHMMRTALGIPSNCYLCHLDFDVENRHCASHGTKSIEWAGCLTCGDLIVRTRCAEDNGRLHWFHVDGTGFLTTGASDLRRECDHVGPDFLLTEEQEEFFAAITRTMTDEQRAAARALYLAIDPDKRDGFLNRCRFIWTIVRAVCDETIGGR